MNEKELYKSKWDPFKVLEMESPIFAKNWFNSKEVKKAYRSMARTLHPDKVLGVEDN